MVGSSRVDVLAGLGCGWFELIGGRSLAPLVKTRGFGMTQEAQEPAGLRMANLGMTNLGIERRRRMTQNCGYSI